MNKAGDLDWSELLIKAPAPIGSYESSGPDSEEYSKESGWKYNKDKTKTLANGLEYRNFISENKMGEGKAAHKHVLYHPGKKEILATVSTATEHDDTDSGGKVKHNNAVYDSKVNPKHRGKGLGKQLYMATLLHHGDLSSDISLTEQSHKAWKHMSKQPGLNVRLAPYNEDSMMSRHRASVRGTSDFDHDAAFPKVDLDG
jgi:GNAT superfamily N-acetyltransferase